MFWCPVDRLRNRVETLAHMQQQGLASVLLPHPASVLPCLPVCVYVCALYFDEVDPCAALGWTSHSAQVC